MRTIVDRRGLDRNAASTREMGHFETEWSTSEEVFAALVDLTGAWIDQVHACRAPKLIILDMGFVREAVPPVMTFCSRRRRQRRLQHVHEFAHVRLGTPALAVEFKQFGRRHGLGIKAGDQPEAIEQQLIRPLQHYEHHAARLRPQPRPVGHIVKPHTSTSHRRVDLALKARPRRVSTQPGRCSDHGSADSITSSGREMVIGTRIFSPINLSVLTAVPVHAKVLDSA